MYMLIKQLTKTRRGAKRGAKTRCEAPSREHCRSSTVGAATILYLYCRCCRCSRYCSYSSMRYSSYRYDCDLATLEVVFRDYRSGGELTLNMDDTRLTPIGQSAKLCANSVSLGNFDLVKVMMHGTCSAGGY